MPAERIQKILARAGIASRRKAEELITEGLVTVNGKIAKLGDKAVWDATSPKGSDAIKVKGKLLHGEEAPVYIAFHKPKGVISALTDPEDRPTLADYLGSKVKARVYPIGRLDFNSEGLLLLTNDGDFAEKIRHVSDLPRIYEVKVRGLQDELALRGLERGARIPERTSYKRVRPYSVKLLETLQSKTRVQVVFLGPTAVDVKHFFEVKGFLVEKVTRTAIGHLTLRALPPGRFRFLTKSQVMALINQPELGLKNLH